MRGCSCSSGSRGRVWLWRWSRRRRWGSRRRRCDRAHHRVPCVRVDGHQPAEIRPSVRTDGTARVEVVLPRVEQMQSTALDLADGRPIVLFDERALGVATTRRRGRCLGRRWGRDRELDPINRSSVAVIDRLHLVAARTGGGEHDGALRTEHGLRGDGFELIQEVRRPTGAALAPLVLAARARRAAVDFDHEQRRRAAWAERHYPTRLVVQKRVLRDDGVARMHGGGANRQTHVFSAVSSATHTGGRRRQPEQAAAGKSGRGSYPTGMSSSPAWARLVSAE